MVERNEYACTFKMSPASASNETRGHNSMLLFATGIKAACPDFPRPLSRPNPWLLGGEGWTRENPERKGVEACIQPTGDNTKYPAVRAS